MARILITSGPTRQYLDPVRYLTNASSGRMGRALAAAALDAGHDVVVVSGPVEVNYPGAARVVPVVSTEEMFEACAGEFPTCDGLIAVAAPCDYRPVQIAPRKIKRTGQPLRLELVETPDIVAALAKSRDRQWMVAFALESHDRHIQAMQKLHRKQCDLIVLNGPEAIHGVDTHVEILDRNGEVLGALDGSKDDVAVRLLAVIEKTLMFPPGKHAD
jgi:phosphopantothenoylcysteine decarboxylase/phosphopantothenate--cysteine ligase